VVHGSLVVIIITFAFQTAAELEKRKENFSKELDFVCADVVGVFLQFLEPA